MPVRPAQARTRRSQAGLRGLEERGATMAATLGMLAAAMLLILASFAAVKGDLPLARGDQDRKEAYAAAEAGIAYYQFHLNQDNSYWTKCTNVPAPGSDPNPVVQAWNGTGVDTRTGHWRKVQGSNAEYAVELLPAPGQTQCVENNQASMLDPATNTFRIRSTGRLGGGKRSIVATFKRQGFLDYVYFTDNESLPPLAYPPGDVQDALDNCEIYHHQGRDAGDCTEIRFVTGDELLGSVHTNDSMLICGDPTFGRTIADNIEATGGWWEQTCNGDPNFVGTWNPTAPILAMPITNSGLATIAGRVFTGTTEIRLNGSNMVVKNANQNPVQQTFAFPSNGLVYVNNGAGCNTTYTRKQQYNNPAGCANVYVTGTYSQDLTIGSAYDIIVRPENCTTTPPPAQCPNPTVAPTGSNGDIIATGNAMLGLIPNNFVRVYHPVQNWNNNDADCTNSTGTMQDVRIDAAILALNQSFIVDNWYCGADLGTITVNGAIAQKHRGTVGTGGGGSGSGYLKDYNYDNDLHYRDPPFFLQPEQSNWTIRRHVEQSPAR